MSFISKQTTAPTRSALWLAVCLIVIELATIGIVFKHGIDFECQRNWPIGACVKASRALVSVYVVLAAVLLVNMLSPGSMRRLLADAGWSRWPLLVNLTGFVIAMLPVFVLHGATGANALRPSYLAWFIGFTLLAGGLLAFLAPWQRWKEFLKEQGVTLGIVVVAAAMAPRLAIELRPIWKLETISSLTFSAVRAVLEFLGYDILADPVQKIIGSDTFMVKVAPVCSGIEGIALVTVFSTIFLALFRSELRFPHALLIYPLGILTSAILNIVRISGLLVIGFEGSPELAVGGFHSHAGWMMFTLISVGIVVIARSMPVFQKVRAVENDAAPPPPLFQDPQAARILPFAIFMISAILAQAFSQSPGVVYPFRVLAMAAALWAFRPILLGLNWTITAPSVIAGLAIGIMWIVVPYTVLDPAPAYAGLAGGWLVGWMILRAVGTIFLVPVIEELFFRDYLEGKLRGVIGPLLAALVSAGLFAILHDRWAEAFVAGLVLSYVMARRGNVTEAIVAHGIANAIVFFYAALTGQMHII